MRHGSGFGGEQLPRQQPSGGIGTKLSPERAKEVEELEPVDAGGVCQWFIGNGTYQEEDKHPSKPNHLQYSDAVHCMVPMRHVFMLARS